MQGGVFCSPEKINNEKNFDCVCPENWAVSPIVLMNERINKIVFRQHFLPLPVEKTFSNGLALLPKLMFQAALSPRLGNLIWNNEIQSCSEDINSHQL